MMYKGIEITRAYNGFYVAFIVNKGYFKADTIKGIKNLIRGALNE